MRNFNIFNRLTNTENQVIGSIDKGSKPEKGLTPQTKLSRRPKIAEDEYTIKHQQEIAAAKTESEENAEGLFIDKDGHRTAINNLVSQTPFKPDSSDLTAMINRDQESLTREKAMDESLEEHLNDEITSVQLANDIKKNKFSNFHPELKSIEKFYINRAKGNNNTKNIGLYQDYNPKLNTGAPGNRKESYRQERRAAEAEKNKRVKTCSTSSSLALPAPARALRRN